VRIFINIVVDTYYMDYMVYMFKYDSTHGQFKGKVTEDGKFLYPVKKGSRVSRLQPGCH
jgi:glyceraldehyde 3-phosphate dehydrogenase